MITKQPPWREIYQVKDGVNYIFDDFYNFEETSSATNRWFDSDIRYIRTRKWVNNLKNAVWNNLRWTEWEIVTAIEYLWKIRAYTKKWYVYSFDWDNSYVYKWVIADISNITGTTTDTVMNNNAVTYGQTITNTATPSVLIELKVRLKKTSWLNSATVNCSVYDASDKDTIILSSNNSIVSSVVGEIYDTYSFTFPSFELEANKQYYFWLSATGVSATEYISIQSMTTSTYVWGEQINILNWVETVLPSDLYFTVEATSPFTYDSTKLEDITTVTHLWWQPTWVLLTVQSYNSSTREVAFTWWVVSGANVWRYAYSNWSWTDWRQSRIIETASWQTFVVSVWYSPNLTAWTTITLYRKNVSQLWFTQLRQPWSNDNLVAIDREWYLHYKYFPNFTKVFGWDNKIVALWQNKDWIVFSDPLSFERFAVNLSVSFSSDTALNIFWLWSYLIVWFARGMGLIRKVEVQDVISWTTNFFYKYQHNIYSEWLHSAYSYDYIGSDLYITNSNNIGEVLTTTSTTIDDIKLEASTVTESISNYFEKLVWWNIYISFINNELIFTWIPPDSTKQTEVFKFSQKTKWWYPLKYNIKNNFWKFFYTISWKTYSANSSWFVVLSWTKDIDGDIENNIESYAKMSWPIRYGNYIWGIVTLQKVSFRLWFDFINQVWWKIKITTSSSKMHSKVFSIWTIPIVQKYNTNITATKWFGSSKFGESIYGDVFRVLDNIPEYIVWYLSLNTNWASAVFTIEIKVDDGSSLCIWDIKTIFLPSSEEISVQWLSANSWDTF